MCGGTIRASRRRLANRGLSPRVRGNPTPPAGFPTRAGSIPACAGEPRARRIGLPAGKVYPRVCGGTQHPLVNPFLTPGLSPRVRGNPRVSPPCSLKRGSIPACAGEPSKSPRSYSAATVYPRVCGGTRRPHQDMRNRAGLSPRVRGNRALQRATEDWSRSIPACAGEPIPLADPPRQTGVYPRVCGGTPLNAAKRCIGGGLSPRVRGNLQQRHWPQGRHRSIPACAGEPVWLCNVPCAWRVYPRVCGGTWQAGQTDYENAGLSPRVRGNRDPVPGQRSGRGSIPACAGEPPAGRLSSWLRGVYPRVCGGTSIRRGI